MFLGGYTPFSAAPKKSAKKQAAASNALPAFMDMPAVSAAAAGSAEAAQLFTPPAIDDARIAAIGGSHPAIGDARTAPADGSHPAIDDRRTIVAGSSTPRLVKGQKTDLAPASASPRIIAAIAWKTAHPRIRPEVSAFLLDERNLCADTADWIFRGNPDNGSGSASYTRLRNETVQLRIAFSRLPGHVRKIALGFSIDDGDGRGCSFRDLSEVSVTLADALTGDPIAQFHIGSDAMSGEESAIIMGELYLYRGNWKFNPIGSGYTGGLRSLCRVYGLRLPEDQREIAAASEPLSPEQRSSGEGGEGGSGQA